MDPEMTLTEDGRFVVISISVGTATEARLDVLDLSAPEAGFRPLVGDFSSMASVVTNVGTTFFLLTDDHAERHRSSPWNLNAPVEKIGGRSWPTEAVLVGARNCGGRLVCHYLQDACSRLAVFELDGAPVRELPLAAVSSVDLDYDRAGVEGEKAATSSIFSRALLSIPAPCGPTTWLPGPQRCCGARRRRSTLTLS